MGWRKSQASADPEATAALVQAARARRRSSCRAKKRRHGWVGGAASPCGSGRPESLRDAGLSHGFGCGFSPSESSECSGSGDGEALVKRSDELRDGSAERGVHAGMASCHTRESVEISPSSSISWSLKTGKGPVRCWFLRTKTSMMRGGTDGGGAVQSEIGFCGRADNLRWPERVG